MVKNFIKSMLTLGLLLSMPQFSLCATEQAPQMIEFEAYLKPQDLALLEKDGQMVYMPTDFIAVMKNFSSNSQEVKDLSEHVNLEYCIAPRLDVEKAVSSALKSCNPNSHEYAVIKSYQGSILTGEADVLTKEDLGERRSKRKCGKFCQLFIQNCASVGSLTVRNNASICGNLCVGGTVNACNFSFTGSGCTGCTGTSTFPNISSCGNIQFNSFGFNTLNAQGAFERFMREIRGNVSFTSTSALVFTSASAGTAITATGIPTASLASGAGFAVSGPVTFSGFSSGAFWFTTTTDSDIAFDMAISLQIPITFASPYLSTPAILLGLQNATQFIPGSAVGSANLADQNTATVLSVGISSITPTFGGAVINLLFNVVAQGAGATVAAAYPNALLNAAGAINTIINNGLSINVLADGPVN